jgi:hypothetical protein
MKTTGYIKDGKYIRWDGTLVIQEQLETTVVDKQYNHDMQRLNHRADMVQPWLSDGKLNPEFQLLYPKEAEGYGKHQTR